MLLYTGKYFIGAIKFFDSNKEFGFIASNNCGMDRPSYNQDFYINTESFAGGKTLSDGTIVVFQVETHRGKLRAVNVRPFVKKQQDWELALTYYGDHETIELKDYQKRNIFNVAGVPRAMVCALTKNFIIDDPNRSPERTLKHFSFLVGHYKYESAIKDKYIYDRDFFRAEKSAWEDIFGILTTEEKKLILSSYPSTIRYVTDDDLVEGWVNSLDIDCSSWLDILKFKDVFENLPDRIKSVGQNKIECAIDNLLEKKYSEITEQNILNAGYLRRDIEPVIELSTRDLSSVVEKCRDRIIYNRFKQEFEQNKDRLEDKYHRENIIRAFNGLGDGREKYIDELKRDLSDVFSKMISQQSYAGIIATLKDLPMLGDDFIQNYRQMLFPLIKEHLKAKAAETVKVEYRMESFITESLPELTAIFTDEQKSEIRQAIAEIVITSDSIELLSLCASQNIQLLDKAQAMTKALELVSAMNFNDFSGFIEYKKNYFDNDPVFNNAVIDKGFALIAGSSLFGSFRSNTAPISEKDLIDSGWSSYELYENCKYLKNLHQFSLKHAPNKNWDNYISSLTVNECLVLFKYEVVTKLPANIITSIIDSISLDSFYTAQTRWYDKPVLKDQLKKKILTESNADLISILAQRLKDIELSQANIPLVVALVELMSINKPEDTAEYYVIRQWEQTFEARIHQFKNSILDNPKLGVILWAVYHKTPANISALSEIFGYLPPYLQIRSVRWMFYLIATGQVKYDAEQLYGLIKNGSQKICFPLEIVFEYLTMREKDPTVNLTHNVMLRLLNDRGNDHSDWFHIRELMNTCHGRYYLEDRTDSNWRYSRDYYNGFVRDFPANSITFYVPSKMIDINGTSLTLTGYNNKYAAKLKELIEITFKPSDYAIVSTDNGITYQFDGKHKLTVSSLSRYFNVKYNNIGKGLEYKIKDEDKDYFCECRLAEALDRRYGISFYWCDNKPCFVPPVRFKTSDEWEQYTLLDFMRILNIPYDYTSSNGKTIKYGYYIFVSSYLKSFVKFYEHLKCRSCGKLMKPHGDITNFESRAINEFSCANEDCQEYGNVVYLNHCFNKMKCNATIDSRDSKQCPNGQYICPECGACCSTENFSRRISNLQYTGGYITSGLIRFVQENLGHWEKKEVYCYRCGERMQMSDGVLKCLKCGTEYRSR